MLASRLIDDAVVRLAAVAPPGADEPKTGALVGALRESGLAAACGPVSAGGAGLAHEPEDPSLLLEALAAVGGADLSAGRLFEGHVNAVKLLQLYAREPARTRWLASVEEGAVWGVWGADGPRPVRLEGGRLSGQKLFASGAGVLDMAIVSTTDAAGAAQLVVVDCKRLEGRLHPEEWTTSGMRATASGRCDLEGNAVTEEDLLGDPGDYHREPHFQGGVWRYAAVQFGAMRAMARETLRQFRQRGHTDAPRQLERLRRLVTACETSHLWLARAAAEVERPRALPSAAVTSILARLVVAEAAIELITDMDAALGAASFALDHPVERRRRDLQFYLRQANPDALAHGAMERLLGDADLLAAWHLA